jgi:aryl-alcohol dehydrogenase-like predicted oxidoreductase
MTVSRLCLGCMSYGTPEWRPWVLSEADARPFFRRAIEAGINFFDTADMYALGMSEEVTGRALREYGRMDEIVLATKVAGPGAVLGVKHIRGGSNVLDRANLFAAVDASLQRLQTDYIDLYQLHWPSRPTNFFGKLEYQHHDAPQAVAIEETLDALAELVNAGKVRHAGLSNETPWVLSPGYRPLRHLVAGA